MMVNGNGDDDDDDDDDMMMLMANGSENGDDDGVDDDDIIVKCKFTSTRKETTVPNNTETTSPEARTSQIARIMGPTWGPPGSCRPQSGPMWAPWTLLSGMVLTLYNSALDKLINSVFPVLGTLSCNVMQLYWWYFSRYYVRLIIHPWH